MTLDTLIMLSGGFVALLPFLGFPNSWDTVFFFLAGVFIIALGIVVRRRGGNEGSASDSPVKSGRSNGMFSESIPTLPAQHDEVA
jgi:hypothetical protein